MCNGDMWPNIRREMIKKMRMKEAKCVRKNELCILYYSFSLLNTRECNNFSLLFENVMINLLLLQVATLPLWLCHWNGTSYHCVFANNLKIMEHRPCLLRVLVVLKLTKMEHIKMLIRLHLNTSCVNQCEGGVNHLIFHFTDKCKRSVVWCFVNIFGKFENFLFCRPRKNFNIGQYCAYYIAW